MKRTEGDRVDVTARIFRDGHETLGAAIRYKPSGRDALAGGAAAPLGNDEWSGSFAVEGSGTWCYRVEAWVDRIASFQDELRRKVAGGQTDLSGELAEGAVLLGAGTLTLDEALAAPSSDRFGKSWSKTLEVDVDRPLARFGAWYELFPRSWGGFEGVRAVLPALADLGFDVVYFPPIHPIGRSNRKGPNNSLEAGPGDPGSPWAIGSELGGHEAIDPSLGTLAQFERLVADANALGLEVALDFAIQCSPDHPWLKQHPEWFNRRPDGTLKYAENPPKRYQDIYNVNFDCPDWKGLWAALREVVLFWVARGVTVFRVDNPHTKPVPFWEWLIAEVRAEHPEVIFLAEAFTRPAMMADARQARVRAELHVLHLEEHALGAARVHGPAARVARVLPAELLRRTRRTSCTSTSCAAGRRHSKRGSCSLRRSRRRTASTRGSRTSRTSRYAKAPRSTSTRRSTR